MKKKKAPRSIAHARSVQLTPIPAAAPLERPLGLGPGVAELVDAAVDATVMWVSEGIVEVCDVPLILWLAAVDTLLEVDGTLEGNNKKPGLVLVVISFGSVWFIAKILNF